MAHVHTNEEDRKRDQNDHHNQVASVFEYEEPVKELEPESKTKMQTFDEWQSMSKQERKSIRNGYGDRSYE